MARALLRSGATSGGELAPVGKANWYVNAIEYVQIEPKEESLSPADGWHFAGQSV